MSCTRKAFPVTSRFSSKGSQQWVRLGLQALAGRGRAQHRPLETRMVLLPREDGGLRGPMKATLYTALHFLSPALSVRTTFIGKENTDSIFKEVKQFVPGPPVQAYSTTAHHHVGESNRTTGLLSQQARPRLPSLLARSVTSVPQGLCFESTVKHHTLIL